MTRITRWDKLILALIIIGAINWELTGFFSFDLVAAIFVGQPHQLCLGRLSGDLGHYFIVPQQDA